ncbi:MAG: helix-turn-helix domain-containing protein [Clostridia bacterium]|nr:helix-turn-helix domain-containing protein [Clostridia bacterium]
MADAQNKTGLLQLSDQTYLLLQKIPSIQQLDELITLCCTTLNASLFINDPQGNVIAHSPFEDAPCPSWAERLKPGRIQKTMFPAGRNLLPLSNTLKHEKCSIDGCTRLYFPLQSESSLPPHVLNLFIWHAEIGHREQMLAALFAGAFASLIKHQSLPAITLHDKQLRVFFELLDYKAGLSSYYLSAVRQSGLLSFNAAFRLICIAGGEQRMQNENLLLLEIAHRLPQAWCLIHGGYLLAIFNEETLLLDALDHAFIPYLTSQQMTACMSAPFFDLMRLRTVFEDCRSILPIAAKRAPDVRLHHAEHYLSFAFLARCQQYFPLRDHFPEGLTRLMAYDRANNRNYLTTLKAYLENNMNANAAAKSIFMHRNTMMQQIEKIEQIMGVSLDHEDTCLYLQLCLRMHELLE